MKSSKSKSGVKKRYFHKMTFLAPGPNVASVAHFEAIERFLQQVERLESKVIDDLKAIAVSIGTSEAISDIYTPWSDISIDETGRILGDWSPWKHLNASTEFQCIELKSSLLEWAHKWHLIDDAETQTLYLEVGIEAIRRYQEALEDLDGQGYQPGDIDVFGNKIQEPKLSLSESLVFQDVLPDTFFDGHFPFSFNPSVMSTQDPSLLESYEITRDNGTHGPRLGWDPRGADGGWNAFEKEMRKLFDAYMTAYKDRALAFLEQNGYEAIQDEVQTDLYFEFFVRFQVMGDDYDDIAFDYENSMEKEFWSDSIRKAIGRVSALVQLPRRSR